MLPGAQACRGARKLSHLIGSLRPTLDRRPPLLSRLRLVPAKRPITASPRRRTSVMTPSIRAMLDSSTARSCPRPDWISARVLVASATRRANFGTGAALALIRPSASLRSASRPPYEAIPALQRVIEKGEFVIARERRDQSESFASSTARGFLSTP